MDPVDEFELPYERLVTEAEVNELRAYMVEYFPVFGSELLTLNPAQFPGLYQIAIAEMRRMQAGRRPRYLPL